ncbi:lamina-associated polypeptide 2, isoforms beta/gamma-like isoform X2 [Solea senegalensis]|uniref:Lamina-associated polypeptide 2, isoforms beta/gamma-like isoform X2 n=1 Tax=Solea senegalensis TaxID=28829 RepID=A0AAV6SR84_SOLSE|nr:lamina-associated polypeptide 2, isoforms beta/gamma-like isoform X2 [Solea senegalensis]
MAGEERRERGEGRERERRERVLGYEGMPYSFQGGRQDRDAKEFTGSCTFPAHAAPPKWTHCSREMQQQTEAGMPANPATKAWVKPGCQRLKSDLVAHNVKLPPAKSKKEVYVELHMQHIDQKKTVEFSSDEEVEEDEEDDMEGEDGENPGDAEMPDPSALTDDDLKAALLKHGVKAGPIVASTRFLYEKKLRKLLQSDGHHGQLNGAKNGMMYSDSEEEEEEENGEDNDAESSAEEENKETVEESDQADEESSQEPVKDDFKHLFPAEITPSGIYATRRRPIKGAAGRPIQYMYPDTPVSPMTLQRRDVERRLVPVHIQILVFVTVTCLLYLIYVCVEDNTFSPIVSLLDNLNPGSNSGEALLHKTEAQDTPALSEWE